jgi:hypothetical protein
MSFSRLTYDTDAYKHSLNESTQPGKYSIQPYAFSRDNHCFSETPEQRVRAARVFKNFEANDLVDIESDLHGTPRKWSNNPKQKFPYVKGDFKNAPKYPESCKNSQESTSTRLEAPQFKRGQTVDRFYSQCLNPQQLNRIRSNMYIGSNTRLYNRDNYVPQIPTPTDQGAALPKAKPAKPAMNCQCTLVDGRDDKSFKLNKVFCKST